MATSSILGGDRAPQQAKGRDASALGPSDSSDSGSDVQGEQLSIDTGDAESRESVVPVDLDSDSDSAGTGDRAAAVPDGAREGADVSPDHIERIPRIPDSFESPDDADKD